MVLRHLRTNVRVAYVGDGERVLVDDFPADGIEAGHSRMGGGWEAVGSAMAEMKFAIAREFVEFAVDEGHIDLAAAESALEAFRRVTVAPREEEIDRHIDAVRATLTHWLEVSPRAASEREAAS